MATNTSLRRENADVFAFRVNRGMDLIPTGVFAVLCAAGSGISATIRIGSTPAHAGYDRSALSSPAGPFRTFAEASSIFILVTVVDTISALVIGRHSSLHLCVITRFKKIWTLTLFLDRLNR